MKKTYQKPEAIIIAMGTRETQMASTSTMSVKVNSSTTLETDNSVGAKSHSSSLWDDEEE